MKADLKRSKTFSVSVVFLFTFGRQILEVLALAPPAFAVAHIEAHGHRTGYILVPVCGDFDQQVCLQQKSKQKIFTV